ncbi:hypothetical protein X777_08843 [Ooceraea biroi]|uniref:Uncharacterized protein n=1 Tax=Ooceraea biroi TaxID=2015173 RepID=A0A026W9G9_OOCBI|nr:hypothetical protein X777_08843 [Ooceraea biroi]
MCDINSCASECMHSHTAVLHSYAPFPAGDVVDGTDRRRGWDNGVTNIRNTSGLQNVQKKIYST